MDSLEQVETLMLVEELFGVSIPSQDAEQFSGPRDIVEWLNAHLAGKKPNQKAASFLAGLARLYERPELIDQIESPWRSEQIAAVVRALYSDEDPQWLQARVKQIKRERKQS